MKNEVDTLQNLALNNDWVRCVFLNQTAFWSNLTVVKEQPRLPIHISLRIFSAKIPLSGVIITGFWFVTSVTNLLYF